MERSNGRFKRTIWKAFVRFVLPVLLLPQKVAIDAEARVTPELSRGGSELPDVVVAGGLDGRVYAVDAWSGEVLWSFDSGGPMVDSSQCLAEAPVAVSSTPPQYYSAAARPHDQAEADVDVKGKVYTSTKVADRQELDNRLLFAQRSEAVQSLAASTAYILQLVPSYDGRLYHFSKNEVKDLGMTMADIVHMNGPVRVAVDRNNAPTPDLSVAYVLLYGEKTLETFSLDAVSGFRRPYLSSAASSHMTKEILFGRSEFMTRAVPSQNASFARCFKIAEYFLDFAEQARCLYEDSDHNAAPEIYVLTKDLNSAVSDKGPSIVAFDPWTSELLWAFEVPDFDVLAVYGISTAHGSIFYKWKVDGPSSTGFFRPKTPLDASIKSLDQEQNQIYADFREKTASADGRRQRMQKSDADKQLIQVRSRNWDTTESEFKLRKLGDNYFLGASEDNSLVGYDSNQATHNVPTFHRGQSDDIHNLHESMDPRRRRSIFWEPIVNDGERGVFITYTHVVAMGLAVATCGILLAWGCYVKGLSASLAQTAIKTMDRSQFFRSHVHRLIVERPGEEDITISSVISNSFMVNALSVDGQVPLLEDSEPVNAFLAQVNFQVIESMLMKKFSRLAAAEAAAVLINGGHSDPTQKLIECDRTHVSSSSQSPMKTIVSRGFSSSSSTVRISSQKPTLAVSEMLSLSYSEDSSFMEKDFSGIYEVEMLPMGMIGVDNASAAFNHTFDNERFEQADLNDDISVGEDSAETVIGAKTMSSSGDSTTGSCCSNNDSCISHALENSDGYGMTFAPDDNNIDEKSRDIRSSSQDLSASSSADSGISSNDEEVLFPFVCQSRFVNEFEELSAIGKGGFGQVMLAENRLDGRKYAIKRVGLNLKTQTSKTLQKFLREVKILALLDHTNIVRYYQAWLEKVEEGTPKTYEASAKSEMGSAGGHMEARSTNILAPISELDFSENQRQIETFYSNGSVTGDNDGGFDWDRGSSSGIGDDCGWKEEDLIVRNKPRAKSALSPLSPLYMSRSLGAPGDELDSSLSALDYCDHWLYIQMQYCAGRNLADYLAVPTQPMELSRMLKIFVQIASALAHVHSCGLIHRDLKPANIFVADVERDEIKLGDFGLSRYAANVTNLNASVTLEDSQQVSANTGGLRETALSTSIWSNMSESNEVTAGVGTYLYASPEQVAGKKYNAKTDIYSLGMILFELCHERFGTTMERYITLRDARDSKFSSGLRAAKRCPEILDMLRMLLSHDPTARPSADEVVQWGQMMYETSIAQKALEVVRSPRNLGVVRAPPFLPGIDHLMAGSSLEAVVASTFSLKVEAAIEHRIGEDGGERRLPNHNLLKQVCDVIAGVSNGKVEIKKCGLHMESEGATILEFELDPQAALADAPDFDVEGTVIVAIEALTGVHLVHRVK
ncbi:hypothetical protein CCR75_007165 [Bremia lactucae]|uniref:non-specific serine/threonine protein kinase n=1 Tax=Bremia lactucae TaxID=4779 RepID=A0A976IGJ7_BRELC|nr:hypothetical protein CCR75_007165 [Bremia lactucae]